MTSLQQSSDSEQSLNYTQKCKPRAQQKIINMIRKNDMSKNTYCHEKNTIKKISKNITKHTFVVPFPSGKDSFGLL